MDTLVSQFSSDVSWIESAVKNKKKTIVLDVH